MQIMISKTMQSPTHWTSRTDDIPPDHDELVRLLGTDPAALRVWLVHDWLTSMRGGERVLLQLARLFPNAKIATLFYLSGAIDPQIEGRIAATSFLQNFPGINRYYRHLLPVMFQAIESIELSPCDLVISTSHCVAKGVGVPPDTPHLCHCFTPMRYIWDMREQYFKDADHRILRFGLELAIPALRQADLATNADVTRFIGTCNNVCRRIERCYNRPADPVYSPIDDEFYYPANVPSDDFYLVVSALVPYKRIDLAVQAFRADASTHRRLIVIGTGPDQTRLMQLASEALGKQIQFLHWQDDLTVRWHYQHCKAFIFPGEEDFGLTPLEAQACGRPVIAFDRGGIRETSIPLAADASNSEQATAIFFSQQSPESLLQAIDKFEKLKTSFDPQVLRTHASRFNIAQFRRKICQISGELLRKR